MIECNRKIKKWKSYCLLPKKVKLMRQVFVQKRERYILVPHYLRQLWTFISKTISIHLLKPTVLTEIGRKRSFCSPIIFLAFRPLYPFIFLTFVHSWPYSFISLAFSMLSVRTYPFLHLGQWAESPLALFCGNNSLLQNPGPS